MPFPHGHFFQSIGYDRGTPWTRKHQTYTDLQTPHTLPPQIDLRSQISQDHIQIYDQGPLNSCTSNAICTAWQYAQHPVDPGFLPSRLFLYYNQRLVEGQPLDQDQGASISDGCRSLESYGLCSERMWPYIPENEPFQPPREAYDEAQLHTIHTPAQLPDSIDHIKDSLAQGKPVIVGIVVYSEFMDAVTARTGDVGLPRRGSTVQGNHAVLVLGYDDSRAEWICRNSWGVGWGDRGHFYLPYEYLTTEEHLASDFWNIATDYDEATNPRNHAHAPTQHTQLTTRRTHPSQYTQATTRHTHPNQYTQSNPSRRHHHNDTPTRFRARSSTTDADSYYTYDRPRHRSSASDYYYRPTNYRDYRDRYDDSDSDPHSDSGSDSDWGSYSDDSEADSEYEYEYERWRRHGRERDRAYSDYGYRDQRLVRPGSYSDDSEAEAEYEYERWWHRERERARYDYRDRDRR